MAQHAGPGRPREFELDVAVRNAMHVFWKKGYAGAALPDLIQGTGLSRGSLYKAFGDKRGLLLAALELYMAEGLAATAELLAQPGSARMAIRTSLLRHARLCADDAGRLGCLVVSVTVEVGDEDEAFLSLTTRMYRRLQQLYAGAIVRGQANGEIAECDEQTLARFLVCQIQGMRVLGKTGVSEAEMVGVVDSAMLALG